MQRNFALLLITAPLLIVPAAGFAPSGGLGHGAGPQHRSIVRTDALTANGQGEEHFDMCRGSQYSAVAAAAAATTLRPPEADFDLLRLKLKDEAARHEQRALTKKLREVWVLIFNPGTKREGIHSLAIDQQNVILGFECERDAKSFAAVLKEQEFYDPKPTSIAPKEVLEFIQGASDVSFVVVPRGSAVVPPTRSREVVDHDDAYYADEANRDRRGQFEIPDGELERVRSQLELSVARSGLEHQLRLQEEQERAAAVARRSLSAVMPEEPFWSGEAFG